MEWVWVGRACCLDIQKYLLAFRQRCRGGHPAGGLFGEFGKGAHHCDVFCLELRRIERSKMDQKG